MNKRNIIIQLLLFTVLGLISACQSTSKAPIPKGVKIGKPYVIAGKTYYPAYDPTYDKIGDASWYGPGFHGKYTANGEVFDQNDMTAAHPTLPMPSLVRVTNLENGKSAIIRINDRGPFAKNRIIDLSKKSAQTLGVHSISRVRVQFLKDETEQFIASLQKGSEMDMASVNAQAEQKKNESIMKSTEPSTQIVESTVYSSHTGQTVADAAPVMTVREGELPTLFKPEKQPEPNNSVMPKIIRSAEASETKPAPMPEPLLKPVVTNNEVVERPSLEPPVEKPQASPPVTASPSAGGQEFVIQVGSFAAEENARKLEKQLSDVAKVFIDKVGVGDKMWWRVRVGNFSDRQTAVQALERVRAKGLPDARIIQQ